MIANITALGLQVELKMAAFRQLPSCQYEWATSFGQTTKHFFLSYLQTVSINRALYMTGLQLLSHSYSARINNPGATQPRTSRHLNPKLFYTGITHDSQEVLKGNNRETVGYDSYLEYDNRFHKIVYYPFYTGINWNKSQKFGPKASKLMTIKRQMTIDCRKGVLKVCIN